MAKLKMKKHPKKPKASASNVVKENYIRRCKEIDKENAHKKSEKLRSKKLDAQIGAIGRKR
jgi:hypothetical protein